MAAVNSTPTPRAPRRASHKVSDCVAAYGAGDGVLSFRHGLKVRERNAIDKALANVWAATARTNRALTMLKQASEGTALVSPVNATGRA